MLNLTPTQIETLPIGAVYISKEGNATAEVRKTDNGTIKVTANCDSLYIVTESLYSEIYHLKEINSELSERSMEQKTIEVNKPTGWQWFWIRTGQIVCSLGFLYAALKAFKRRFIGV